MPMVPMPRADNILANDKGQMAKQQSWAEQYLVPLPLLRDASADVILQSRLFLQKLRQCQRLFNFDDPLDRKHEKAVKTDALRELNEFVAINRHFWTMMESEPDIGEELFRTIELNLFRTLPPIRDLEPDLDDALPGSSSSSSEMCLEPAWPHLQLVYRLLRQLVDRLAPCQLSRHISSRFCAQLLELFRSEDPREREQLKLVLYNVYSRAVELRTEIRKHIAHTLLEHSVEHAPANGVDELLQILGDIINGFNVPLKGEHCQFLLHVLLPLHKSPLLGVFFNKLAYCVTLYIEKEPELAKPVLNIMLRHWPQNCSAKEVMFISELEEILARIGPAVFRTLLEPLLGKLARCATSQHARVAERTLQLWNNPKVLILLQLHSHVALPIIFPALYETGQSHWSSTVTALVFKTLKSLRSLNVDLFDDLAMNYEENRAQQKWRRQRERHKLWKRLAGREGTDEDEEEDEEEDRFRKREEDDEGRDNERKGHGTGGTGQQLLVHQLAVV